MPAKRTILLACLSMLLRPGGVAQSAPPITLDEFMNATEIGSARIAPDGHAVVVATESPDWAANRFRNDLWLWTQHSNSLRPLTQSGHDRSPSWSPDGKYIAFVSDRPMAMDGDAGKDETARVWIIPVEGGEAFPLYSEKLEVHAFAWSSDGSTLFFSVEEPLTPQQTEQQQAEWKDVVRWREQERGDLLLALPLQSAIARMESAPEAHVADAKPATNKQPLPVEARQVTRSPLEIDQIAIQPEGGAIAFETGPPSHRTENPAAFEIFTVPASGGDAHRLTNNQALESNLHWSPDGKRIYFQVGAAAGSVDGPYRDVQGRLYEIDPANGSVRRLGSEFKGSWEDYSVASDGTLIACGLTGVEQHLYRIQGASATEMDGRPGNSGGVDAALHSPALLFTHSTIDDPTQVYLASSAANLKEAAAVTDLNPEFKRELHLDWQPYEWKSADGTAIQGVLIYPAGEKGRKHLRVFTLIHGGPADADGNRFGANWYDWATYAAANGWVVFRPNYRGSSGYGDDFMTAISPHIVSLPGQDILSGVDALVRDGIADPDHLAVGGYSYGGYMTDWLITQTPRFKAAVTGAGAIEHAANWGNDDLTFDDAWYLSGTPWEKPEMYEKEAALFQMDRVKTPTHIVGGQADIRVSYFEDVLLERSLEKLGVPHSFLAFPGEGHGLGKDPWHGYIKVREELKWLNHYAGPGAQ